MEGRSSRELERLKNNGGMLSRKMRCQRGDEETQPRCDVCQQEPPTVTAFVRILDELQYYASLVSFALLGTILPLVLYQVCFFCCLPVDWVV
jgi:hypothetical protein